MNEISISLKLINEDAGVLERALEIRLENLRFELARTHDHDYKIDLRHQLNRLETIERDLKALLEEKKAA